MCKTDHSWEPTVGHRELSSALPGDLSGEEIPQSGDICVCVDDPLCSTAETDITVESNYTPVKAQ